MKNITISLFLAAIFATQALGHCQIPCGIYGDEDRFTAMLEDVTTLRKSVNQINELSAAKNPNYNQLVRWVSNKETHSDRISDTVLKYFLQQRIKEGQDQYEEKLVELHRIVVLAMKVEQNTDLKYVDELESAIGAFHQLYHGGHSHG